MVKEGVLEKGKCIVISPFFTVPKRGSTELRPVHNLKRLNNRIKTQHFTLRALSQAIALAPSMPFMTKMDLRKGYWQVLVKERDRALLGTRHRGQEYRSRVLPFGLSTSPFVFQKITHQACRLAARMGIVMLVYIDDFLILSETREKAQKDLSSVTELFAELGLVLNHKKTEGPTQALEFLGVWLDTKEKRVGVSRSRQEELRDLLTRRRAQRRWTRLQALQLAGKLVFLKQVFPFAVPFTKEILKTRRRDTRWVVTEKAREDIDLWLEILEARVVPWPHAEADLLLWTDASYQGQGAALYKKGVPLPDTWAAVDVDPSLHITALELQALLRAILFFDLRSATLLWATDAVAARGAVDKGSMRSSALHAITKEIWREARKRSIWIHPTWVPGVLNHQADSLSRQQEGESSSHEAWVVDVLGPLRPVAVTATRFILGDGRLLLQCHSALMERVLLAVMERASEQQGGDPRMALRGLALCVSPLSPRAVAIAKTSSLRLYPTPRRFEDERTRRWRERSRSRRKSWLVFVRTKLETDFASQEVELSDEQ